MTDDSLIPSPLSSEMVTDDAPADEPAELLKWEVWARVELDKDRDTEEVIADMVRRGFAPDAASELVTRVHHQQVLDYQSASDERNEWRAAIRKYRRTMVLGGIYFSIGLVVSVRGLSIPGSVGWVGALIASSAVAFGLVRFAYGLLGYLRPMSKRLGGQHIPGRRIGSFTPGTPRSRFSRFQ